MASFPLSISPLRWSGSEKNRGFSSGKLGWGFSGNIKKPLRRSYNWWFLLTYLLRITNIYTYSQLLIEGLNADRHPDGDWSFPSCILQMTELWHRYLAVLILLSNSLNLISTSFCEARCAESFVGSMHSFQGLLEVCWRTQTWEDQILHPSTWTNSRYDGSSVTKRYLSRCGNSPRPCKCLEDSNWRAFSVCRWTMVNWVNYGTTVQDLFGAGWLPVASTV